ncbi:MAG: PilZ domain-containing protein [Candidatus Omnitrophica bacterium]|nr:PilZ domain-containing protein [Candidatus Omnitrophota bacterium]
MQERRIYPRFSCPTDKFCSFRFEGEKDFSGNIMNISRKGINFSSVKALKSSGIVNLNLTYSDIERQIFLKIKIIWSHHGKVLHTYGARFINIPAEDKASILDGFFEDWKKKILLEKKFH